MGFIKRFLSGMFSSKAFRYLFAGGCSTVVNFGVYTLLCFLTDWSVDLNNIISIVCAVIFAYVSNKIFVFRSKTDKFTDFFIEFVKFIGARLFTMFLEIGGVYVFYNIFDQNEIIAKAETQIAVIVTNYLISIFFVFTKKE